MQSKQVSTTARPHTCTIVLHYYITDEPETAQRSNFLTNTTAGVAYIKLATMVPCG